MDPPQGLSLRHLSRKLIYTHSRDSAAISALWLRRAELSATLRHAWLRNLPGDNPARPEAHHGQGDWLRSLPGRWSHTLLDNVFRWGLQQRIGVPAPGAGEPCGRTPPGGKITFWKICPEKQGEEDQGDLSCGKSYLLHFPHFPRFHLRRRPHLYFSHHSLKILQS